ncbi:MAG: hypothetical protein HC869_19995 [Rhodospirillales bacterium]|nr:hypothetical protein [Rhodospirillales bacterium]
MDRLYDDVRLEVQDISQYLEAEAARRQNDTMMRLTVVTTFGLIGTVATGFLGMNLFSHSAQSVKIKVGIFVAVFVPTPLFDHVYGGQVAPPFRVLRRPFGWQIGLEDEVALLFLCSLANEQTATPIANNAWPCKGSQHDQRGRVV